MERFLGIFTSIICISKVIYKHLDRIQQLIEKMEPTDIRVKHREWYLGNRYLFDKGNYANRWKMLEDKKLSAVKKKIRCRLQKRVIVQRLMLIV